MVAGLKQKTHKVLDIEVEGFKVVCVVHYEQATNPYAQPFPLSFVTSMLQDCNMNVNSKTGKFILQDCTLCVTMLSGVPYMLQEGGCEV